MATLSAPRKGSIAARPSVRPRRPTGTPASREQRLAEARAREVRARHELARAIARMERTYTQAVRNLEAFDAYLGTVRKDLRQAVRHHARRA